MFSLIFFAFVALIVAMGYFAVTWRRKHRIPLDSDVTQGRDTERVSASGSAFNEPSTRNLKGGIVPTENKLSQTDFTDEEGNNEEGTQNGRSIV
jgi:hypothetical protein